MCAGSPSARGMSMSVMTTSNVDSFNKPTALATVPASWVTWPSFWSVMTMALRCARLSSTTRVRSAVAGLDSLLTMSLLHDGWAAAGP
jgi:hypothetical protein